MKEFFITSTIKVRAESREELEKLVEGEDNKEIMYELYSHAVIDGLEREV